MDTSRKRPGVTIWAGQGVASCYTNQVIKAPAVWATHGQSSSSEEEEEEPLLIYTAQGSPFRPYLPFSVEDNNILPELQFI